MSKRIVIALGGNALGNTPYEQLALVTETAKPIVDLIAQGNEVIIAHGNGPQVGMINLGMATAAEAKAIKSDMPFPECGAMSQGYIGYHLQNAIGNELASRGMNKDVATVVTQVLVDEADPAFQHPTKPIGAFMTEEEAKKLAAEKGRGDDLTLYRNVEELAPQLIAKHRRIYKGVSPNVDFYSGLVYSMLDLPPALYTPIFAAARIVGWSAHRMEELKNVDKIIRPAYKPLAPYREYIKLDDR